jgi:DNA polymerase
MGITVWLPRVSAEHQAIAAETDNWDSLKDEVAACERCSLCESRSSTVFGSDNKNAEWLIVGEAPGYSEDQQGLPFTGKEGLLLTEMLRAMDIDREDVFITNVLKCNPPDNREPKPIEIESCKAYLQRQQGLIKPKIILALGHVAAQTLLNTNDSLAELRGKIHVLNDTPVVVTHHPTYLLRSMLDKLQVWTDLKLAMQAVKNSKG